MRLLCSPLCSPKSFGAASECAPCAVRSHSSRTRVVVLTRLRCALARVEPEVELQCPCYPFGSHPGVNRLCVLTSLTVHSLCSSKSLRSEHTQRAAHCHLLCGSFSLGAARVTLRFTEGVNPLRAYYAVMSHLQPPVNALARQWKVIQGRQLMRSLRARSVAATSLRARYRVLSFFRC